MFATWIVCLFALVMSATFFWQSFSIQTIAADPAGPAIVPQILCVLTGTAALAQMLKLLLAEGGIVALSTTVSGFFAGFRDGLRGPEVDNQRVAFAIVISALYPWAMQNIGFILATAAMIAIVSWLCQLRFWRGLAMTVITPVAIFYLFSSVLQARVPRGDLFDILSLI
jgi:hypothetical protein